LKKEAKTFIHLGAGLSDPRIGAALQRAVSLESAGDLAGAETLLRQIITLEPLHGDALHLLALLLGHARRLDEAAELASRAVAVDPRRATFLRTQSELLRSIGQYYEADKAGRRSAELDPRDHHAPTVLAAIAHDRLDLPGAIAWGTRALDIAPDHPEAHFELAKAYLLGGNFARGWEEHEWRFRISGAPPLMPPTPEPQWEGQKLDGTLLLIADQGFGDVIQFMRYIPWAASICPDLALATDAAIGPLVAQMHRRLPQFSNWSDRPDFVAFCPLSGLPRLHKTDLATIPANIPYLRADPPRAAWWRSRLDAVTPPGRRRIGIAWAGRPTHNNDFNRSVRLQTLAPLGAIPDVVWVSLQKGPAQDQIAGAGWDAPLLDVGRATESFVDTMAVIDGLDLVLAVDTSVAHLAGAMGKPVWLMLPYAPDWRWLLARTDSPWYPTARLFRQKRPRDWASVVDDVARALQ